MLPFCRLTGSGDREIGLRLFQDAVVKGEMSSDSALLYTYGMYLAHGGTPDGFMEMTDEDIEIMHTSLVGTQIHDKKDYLEGIAKILAKLIGGTE